jgi:peptidyl-prolyl cis-trans isomerase C
MTRISQNNSATLSTLAGLLITAFVASSNLAWADEAKKPKTPSAKTTSAKVADKNSNDILVKGPHGLTVTVADVLSEVNKMPPANRPEFFKNTGLIQQVANNLLIRRVLAKEASAEKLDQDEVVKAALAVAKDRVLSDAHLNQYDARNEPTPQAMESYARNTYSANIQQYETAPQTRASHILIEKSDDKSMALAQDVLNKLKTGAKFEELAKEFSKDPGSAARGGDLGFFGQGRMVKPFEEAVNALAKPGDLSGLVESQFGYHIIRLDERKPKAVKSFDEVKASLMTESRTAILSGKRIQMVQGISAQMQFDKEAIDKLSKEGTAAVGGQ